LATAIAPAELDRLVGEHLGGLPGAGHSALIALDGQAVRGTRDAEDPHGEHLLSAYLPAEGLTLGQVATGGRDNEIRVAPRLVAGLDLRGKVVMADALHTQRPLSQRILAAGGEYFWLVKDNQPDLRADIAYLFAAADRTVEGGRIPHDFQTARRVDKGHGRREVRTITVSGELKGYSDWPGSEQVVRLERERLEIKRGKRENEVVYGLTSLTPAEARPARLLALSRAYWGIENGLHRRRDVTFREDATRLTQGRAGHVMAALNNLVIGLLRHAGAVNLAAARRWWDAHLTQSPSPLIARPIT
jgi:predicted transposase YbfD/YdcC